MPGGRPLLRAVALLGLLALAVLLLRSAQERSARPDEALTLAGQTWGTTYSIIVPRAPAAARPALEAAIRREMSAVDQAMSRHREGSTVDLFNRWASTEPFPVPEGLAGVVAAAREVSERTGGAYDITIRPIVRLWGFDRDGLRVAPPAPEELAAALERVGYRRLEVLKDPPALRKDRPDLEIDLSSIAKGYGVDRVCGLLEGLGHTDYMVEIGGDLRVRGRNPDGEPWRIGVERPVVERSEVHRVLRMESGALATSGEYRNFYDLDGLRVSHTFDARSGWPVAHAPTSIAVAAETCMEADAWATALNILGADEGLRLAGELGLAALFVTADPGGGTDAGARMVARASPAFEERFPSGAAAATPPGAAAAPPGASSAPRPSGEPLVQGPGNGVAR